jgi:hypothetical protein
MKRGAGWPIAVALVLALTVGANIWVAVVASNDPSFAIEPDYYRKAVAWDSAMAQSTENRRLGWRVESSLDAYTRNGGTTLRVQLLDSTGAPIRGATVNVAALYNARAGHVLNTSMTADSPSGYAAHLAVAHRGSWELRFDIHRGAERYTSVARVEAVAAGGAP